MEKEEFTFQEGKWYKSKDGMYGKFLLKNKSFNYPEYFPSLEYIDTDGNYTNTGEYFSLKNMIPQEIPLSEIQQYLPDGHPDKINEKINLIGRYVKCLEDAANACSVDGKMVKKDHYYQLGSLIDGEYKLKNGNWCGYDKPNYSFESIDFELMPEGFVPPSTNYKCEVVHCTNAEELNYVKKKHNLDYGSIDPYLENTGICINSTYYFGGYTKLENWKTVDSHIIYTFQEWCDKFGHKPDFKKSETKDDNGFIVGKKYKHRNTGTGYFAYYAGKTSGAPCFEDIHGNFGVKLRISPKGYISKGTGRYWKFTNLEKEFDPTPIEDEQWIPQPDEWVIGWFNKHMDYYRKPWQVGKVEGEYVYVKDKTHNTELSTVRKATPEEIKFGEFLPDQSISVASLIGDNCSGEIFNPCVEVPLTPKECYINYNLKKSKKSKLLDTFVSKTKPIQFEIKSKNKSKQLINN